MRVLQLLTLNHLKPFVFILLFLIKGNMYILFISIIHYIRKEKYNCNKPAHYVGVNLDLLLDFLLFEH